ncbi:MAG: MBL fold metallo-hydrolase [Lentisphaeria bacterium]|nr:MBL fold metallo-hydrolase [Lentisphaeria bacterium]
MKWFALVSAFCFLGAAIAANYTGWNDQVPAGTLRICQIDNPEQIGDIYLVIAPDDTVSLVDTGVITTGETVLIPELEKRGIRRIDRLVISHFHSDHAGGAVTLLADPAMAVGRIFCTFPPEEQVAPGTELRLYRALKTLAARRNIPWVQATVGDSIDFGAGVSARVVGAASAGIRDHNGLSLVFKLTYGKFSMLFTGDCSFAEEKLILRSGADLRSDVLKLAHHGGAGSNGDAFLDAVKPRFAVATQPEWLSLDPRGLRVNGMLKKRQWPYFPSWKYPDLVIFSDGENFGCFVPDRRPNGGE